MAVVSGDCKHAGSKAGYVYWRGALCTGTVPQLANTVCTPAFGTAGACQRAGGQQSGGNCGHACSEAGDVARHQARQQRSVVTQLTILVQSPALDAAANGQRTGMAAARRDRDDTRSEASNIDR